MTALSGENTRRKIGERSEAHHRACADRAKLLERLEGEGADDLTKTFQKCGEKFQLVCTSCGGTHEAEKRCSKKWCPVCSRKIAAKRSMKFEKAVAKMEWPLFVTLTMRNVDDLKSDAVRTLRRAFGKLRQRKLWKAHVKGGVASIEVTNIGNGWHPHLHAVLDCEWLAWFTPKPRPRDSRAQIKKLCERAAQELERVWAKLLKQPTASVKVKRVTDATVTKEVLKYSVKGSDLLNSPDDVSPILRCLEATRLVTTFGSLFGIGKGQPDETERPSIVCPCGAEKCWMPQETVDRIARKTVPQKPRPLTARRPRVVA